ncbi:hypothetical protein DL98DRAFT_593287 [Cadophora sp. DSE1049]|nr:hypothetical protein DL98DRAFT_593287 [Cadophora sp. DSE1049]
MPENNINKGTMQSSSPGDIWAVPSRPNTTPLMANRQQDKSSIDEEDLPSSGGSKWGVSPKQPIQRRSFPDCTTGSSAPHLSSSQQDFMSIQIQGNAVQPVPQEFRAASSPPKQNNSPQYHTREHSFSRSAHRYGRAQMRPNGPNRFGLMYRQPDQIRYGIPPSVPQFVAPRGSSYERMGKEIPEHDLQGGFPMTRGNGSAMPHISHPRTWSRERAPIDSAYWSKQNLEEFSEDGSLEYSSPKR